MKKSAWRNYFLLSSVARCFTYFLKFVKIDVPLIIFLEGKRWINLDLHTIYTHRKDNRDHKSLL